MKQLRPYQEAAHKSLTQFLFERKGNPLVVAPVAAGKSLMIAEFIKRMHELYPRLRIVMLTHVKELLQQNAAELIEQYPTADMGFYCAGLGQKRLHNDITFASIQSIHNKIANFNRVPELVIIDECHLISHKDSTTYRKFIDAVLKLNPNCRIIGYTGTPFRADTGRLYKGENKLFDDVAYEISMEYMIEEGYWARPVCPAIATKIEVTGVGLSKGDYIESQLQRFVNTDEINDPCIKELVEKGKDRKKWLVFTCGIQHAEEVTKKLNEARVSARFVHSGLSASENDAILKAHKAGEFTALVNVAKLTTGYNDPTIDLLAFMRPTRSPVLYIQMTGRGVRVVYADGYDLSTKEGRLEAIANSIKPDCVIMDFGSVVATLGAIDQLNIKKEYMGEEESDGLGEAIMKICPACAAECSAAQRYCLECGYSFIKLSNTVSEKAVVSSDEEPEWVNVLGMYTARQQTPDSWQPSMKVTYATMLGSMREWVCFEHWKAEQGDNKRYAWDMAVKWHKDRLPEYDIPKSVSDALDIEYPQPSKILVRRKGKYYEVIDYEWPEPKTAQQIEDEDFEIPF